MTMLASLQSVLFVPGSRPDRFDKALASGADAVCIDLEDAVGPQDKPAARQAALNAIAADRSGRLVVRINGLLTRAGLDDLCALADHAARPPLVFIPKVEAPTEIAIARAVLADASIGFAPLIETVAGLRAARAIAAAPGVAAVMFGGNDYAASIAADACWDALYPARAELVMAGVEAGVPILDVPCLVLDDDALLAEETRRIKAMGMAGKTAVHPKHIPVIHSILRPSPEDIAEAEAAQAAYLAAQGGAVRFRGRMLEAPVMRRYRQILALRDRLAASGADEPPQ